MEKEEKRYYDFLKNIYNDHNMSMLAKMFNEQFQTDKNKNQIRYLLKKFNLNPTRQFDKNNNPRRIRDINDLTDDQINFIRKMYENHMAKEIVKPFNETYKTNYDESQIKRIISKYKLQKYNSSAPRHLYTKEQLDFIEKTYLTNSIPETVKLYNETFNENKTYDQIKYIITRHGFEKDFHPYTRSAYSKEEIEFILELHKDLHKPGMSIERIKDLFNEEFKRNTKESNIRYIIHQYKNKDTSKKTNDLSKYDETSKTKTFKEQWKLVLALSELDEKDWKEEYDELIAPIRHLFFQNTHKRKYKETLLNNRKQESNDETS